MNIPGTDQYADVLEPPDKISAVYFLVKNDRVIYVGQTKNLLARYWTHETVKDFDHMLFIRCQPSELLELEDHWTLLLRPELQSEEALRQAQRRMEKRAELVAEF
jgi:predicted GIY-YIG superfamily endonuclease